MTTEEALFRIVVFALIFCITFLGFKWYRQKKKNDEMIYWRNRKNDVIEFTRYKGDLDVMNRVKKKEKLIKESRNPYGIKVHAIIWENTKDYTEDFERQFLPRLGEEATKINQGIYKRYKDEYTDETLLSNLHKLN